MLHYFQTTILKLTHYNFLVGLKNDYFSYAESKEILDLFLSIWFKKLALTFEKRPKY